MDARRTIGALCLLAALAWGAAAACPGVKWKGGKQTVECRNRGLITLPSNIDPQTQVLDVSGSNLQTVPREAFARANLLNLQKAYLASCRIGQIEASAWRGLTNLVELDLSDNLLADVPSASLAEAPSLRELRLSGNPLRKLEPGAFERAPGLVKLDLSDCQIESIAPGAFDGLEQLSHLRLSGNRLEELRPDVVASLPARLHGFELQGNPWICDCRARHLRQWLQRHNVPIPASAACLLPPRLAGRSLVELQVDDFACPPQAIPPPAAPLLSGGPPSHLHVEAAAGENATLVCRMSGVPSPEITWLWRGRPMVNGSVPEPDVVSGVGGGEETPAPGARTVLIVEEGKYEKTSYLILSPARETDSGEFVCVAANAAGLARANLTLRVDVQPPVAGGLGGAQIAGIGAALFILLAAVVAVLLLLLVRTRGSAEAGAGAGAKEAKPGGQGAPLGQVAFVSPGSPDKVLVATAASSPNRPDLLHDYATAAPGDYLSAQTDSFYPSALWDHVLPQACLVDERPAGVASPISLPHVPLVDARSGFQNPRDVLAAYLDGEPDAADSYSQPRTMPAFAPYPPDFGLPKEAETTAPPPPAPSASVPAAGSCYGSRANTSTESSPSSKSPRFWPARQAGAGAKRAHHHFARDSPDEGYQEECATDV